jgi:hypothetical protein
MPTPTCTPHPPTVPRRRHLVLTAEARPAYRSAPTAASVAAAGTGGDDEAAGRGDATERAGTGVPFGLPVLAELPMLAGMLRSLTDADRAMSDALGLLAQLLADDEVVRVSGVSVEEWVGIVARHTRMDRRLLLRTARLLHRFPTLGRAVADQQLSWPQLRGLSLVLRDCPPVLDEQVDGFLARLLPHLADTDPDAVIEQTRRAVGEWTAELAPESDEASARNHLHLQPRLDGTGGRVSGELDAIGLAIVDDATAPHRTQLDHPGGVAGARADNLLTRLTHTCPPASDPGGPIAHAPGDDPAGDGPGTSGTAAADDTRGPVAADADGVTEQGATTAGPDPAAGPAGQPGRPLPDVKLLLRCDYADLLDATRTPATLLTRLVGGSLRLTAAAARQLLDARGAELRTVIVDHGQVLGVGRATRIPPGWLRDATLAVHDTCTGPLCDRPARTADLDHATPWWPTHPGDPPGTTDLTNLGPLCATTNRAKETAGWRARQHPDGRRTWTHPRTGLTITSIPATWRPPPDGTGPP